MIRHLFHGHGHSNLTDEQDQRYRPWFDNARRVRELVNELHALSIQAAEEAEDWHDDR